MARDKEETVSKEGKGLWNGHRRAIFHVAIQIGPDVLLSKEE